MKKLLFEVMPGKIFTFTVNEYVIDSNFYYFKDLKDGKERQFHKSLLRGIENV